MGTELKKLPARTVVEWPFEGAYERAEKCRVFLLTAGLISGEEDRNIRKRMERISVKRYRLGARFKTEHEAKDAAE